MIERLRFEAFNEKQADEMYGLLKPFEVVYSEDISGSACVRIGVIFVKTIFGGSLKNPKFLRNEIVQGTIIADSYGAARGQHTFTILKEDGVKLLIKGRNLYRNGLFAKPRNQEERREFLSEKHARGMENLCYC